MTSVPESAPRPPSSHGPVVDSGVASAAPPRRPLISTLGWDINAIVASSPNFHHIERVHCSSPNAKVDIVIPKVESDGTPLIINGWNRHSAWPKALFDIDWLKDHGDQNPSVRNIHTWSDFKIPMKDFIEKLRETPVYASANEQERLYGKDGECPAEWTEWLHSGAIPSHLLLDGPSDFLKFLPDEAKVQTLMCYMGIGDTFTPFHKDLCASSGQNLMCYSENSGSAFWFMTKSSAAPQVAEYFHQLGQEVDLETHVVTIDELAKAPFEVYMAEQLSGDLVLVPPRSCHQVVNKGGITIKTSWSRMSLHGLQTALWHELPIYHRVCRLEIYKVKSNIFHALQHFTKLVESSSEDHDSEPDPTATQHLKQLVCLFDDIIAGEISLSRDSMPHVSQSETSHTDNLSCDFCGADIFQSFFECDSCLPASSEVSADVLLIGDGLVLCPLCYVEGRTCQCENMQPVQCRPFSELLRTRDRAVRAIQRIEADYISIHGYLSEKPHQLLSGRDANVFEAACRLFQQRQTDTKAMRSCRVRLSHQVPAPAAIYCKACHFSRCYTHLLELDSVHPVDAMMVSDRLDGDMDWHQYHRTSSHQYQGIRQRVIEDEQKGARPNASHRLIYLAKTFSTCRSVAPEVTKHGWYDRFVQTIRIPIANSLGKALVGLPEEVDGNGSHTRQASEDSFPNNLASESKGDLQTTHSCRTPTLPPATPSTSSGGIPLLLYSSLPNVINTGLPQVLDVSPPNNLATPTKGDAQMTPSPRIPTPPLAASSPTLDVVPLVPHSSLSIVIGTRSPIVNPSSKSGTLPDVSAGISPLSPLYARHPRRAMPPPSTGLYDSGNLSDLTDLPTELDSPSHSSIIAIPVSQMSERQLSMPMEFSSSLLSAEAASPNTQPATVSKLKSKVVFDCVEISPPGWQSGKRDKHQSSSRQKRKRIAGPFLSDIAGPSDSDYSPSAAQMISSRSLFKRKRKMSKGPASRLSPSSRRIHSSVDMPSRPPSPNNFLANALNQTFRLNSTTSTHVPTTPLFNDTVPPVSNVVISPTSKPQYRNIGVQKDLNFSRKPTTTRPAEELSSCILRLEAENCDLQAQAERYKNECEVQRASLAEFNRRYTSSSEHYHHPQHHHAPPPGGQSNVPSHAPPDMSVHPRWRTRANDNRPDVNEPDLPPIETLYPPSSPESVSSRRRRTPTGPRGMRTREHGHGHVHGGSDPHRRVQSGPYYGYQQHRRRRGFSESANGRRQRERQGPPPSLERGDRLPVIGGPTPPNSAAMGEAGALGTSPTFGCDNDKAPLSPPSTASDRVQLSKSLMGP